MAAHLLQRWWIERGRRAQALCREGRRALGQEMRGYTSDPYKHPLASVARYRRRRRAAGGVVSANPGHRCTDLSTLRCFWCSKPVRESSPLVFRADRKIRAEAPVVPPPRPSGRLEDYRKVTRPHVPRTLVLSRLDEPACQQKVSLCRRDGAPALPRRSRRLSRDR